MKLGDHGAFTPDEARLKALAALGAVQKGGDPLEVIKEARKAPTMDELCDEYLERHARAHKKPRSVKEDENLISQFIRPRLGKIKVAALKRSDIAKLHSDLHETPTRANRLLACLSKMFNLAELWGHRPDGSNPCRHIKRYKENKRKRFLSAEEIARVAKVLAEEEKNGRSYVAAQAVRLLLLTGCRMNEVLTLEWDWVDLDDQRIDLPDSKSGEKVVWLNAAAIEILDSLKAYQERKRKAYAKKGEEWLGGRWVLPGRTNGTPLQWLEPFWQPVRKFAKIEDVLLFGLWDSTGPRGGGGCKFARAIVSEIIGLHMVDGIKTSSRIDPLQIQLQAKPVYRKGNSWTLDPAKADKDDKQAPVMAGKDGRPSEVNHGNIVPSITPGGVTISKAVQTTVLSLPALRRLKFPTDNETDTKRDEAARIALAALALCGATLIADEGCDLRSRCFLIPTQPFVWELIGKPGSPVQTFTLSTDNAIKIFNLAMEHARESGLDWREKEMVLKPSKDLVELVRRSQALSATQAAEGND